MKSKHKKNRKCTKDIAGSFPVHDIEEGRIYAALSYLVFFIPVIIFPENRFGLYHANQSLILLLLSTIGVTLLMAIGFPGMILSFVLFAFCVICSIRGFVLALSRKAKCVPVLGKITIIAFEAKEWDLQS